MPNKSTGSAELFWSQFAEVRAAAEAQGMSIAVGPSELGQLVPTFIYQDHHLLIGPRVDANDPDLARYAVGAVPPNDGEVRLVKIADGANVLAVVGELAAKFGAGEITPNHLVSICPVNLCPATEPQPVPLPPGPAPVTSALSPPSSSGERDGAGVTVHVIDTGLIPRDDVRHPWLYPDHSPTTGEERNFEPPLPATADIPIYYGHGTFVGGVVKWFARGVSLRVRNALRLAAATTEYQLAEALLESLPLTTPGQPPSAPQIVSLSAGCTTRGNRPLLALEPVRRRLLDPNCHTLLVAAAGNDGEDRPFWPAAWHADPALRDVVVSVGALRKDSDKRACFSNHGPWVRVFAPGEQHVNAFPVGTYTYHEPKSAECLYLDPGDPLHYQACTCVGVHGAGSQPVRFDGLAQWSGTSFATPLIAAKVAAFLAANPGLAPREAGRRFLERSTVTVGGISTYRPAVMAVR